ncbi:MAG: hypothetical protein PHI90_06480 [Clostridia bacterium]|nr:hypothetical protein [Clostridia bacterium]MDD4048456.1 hypothetical protein [Clostridia bacterium]
MKCPLCGSSSVGKVGVEQYYCWNCFVEYQFQGDETRVYSVEEDGSLMEI